MAIHWIVATRTDYKDTGVKEDWSCMTRYADYDEAEKGYNLVKASHFTVYKTLILAIDGIGIVNILSDSVLGDNDKHLIFSQMKTSEYGQKLIRETVNPTPF